MLIAAAVFISTSPTTDRSSQKRTLASCLFCTQYKRIPRLTSVSILRQLSLTSEGGEQRQLSKDLYNSELDRLRLLRKVLMQAAFGGLRADKECWWMLRGHRYQEVGTCIVWKTIFKTVNVIASKKYDATIEHMLAQAVLSEIDVAKRERGAGYQ